MLGVEVQREILCRVRFESAEERIGIVGFKFAFRRHQGRRIRIQRVSGQRLEIAPVRVPVTKMKGIVIVDLVIALDRVLVLAVLSRLERLQVADAESVRPGAAGDVARKGKEITIGGHAINREVFHPKSI